MNETCSSKNGCKPNKGVSCDVHNCIHHDGECYCMADRISVGPSNACTCNDTVCATFRAKDE